MAELPKFGLPPGPNRFPALKELSLLVLQTSWVGPYCGANAHVTDQSTERQVGHCGMEWSALALEPSGWAES